MKRRGFTLIELVVVFSVLGVLFTIAFPMVRDGTTRAKAANLIEIAHLVKAAYVEAGEPTADKLVGPPGELPALFSKALTAGSFRTSDGIELQVVGSDRQVYLAVWGDTPQAQQILAMLHQQELDPHTYLKAAVMIPLGEPAVVSVGPNGNGPGGGSVPPAQQQTPSNTPPSGQQTTPNVVSPPQQPPAQQPPAQQPPAQQPQQPQQPQTPQCSSSLSPGQYKQCTSGGSGNGNGNGNHHGQGWFRNPHSN